MLREVYDRRVNVGRRPVVQAIANLRQSRAVPGLGFLSVLLLFVASPVRAASGPSPGSFEQLISGMQLIVVAKVSGSPSTGFTYSVERVLKGGSAPSPMVLPPDAQAAVQSGWQEVVIAFADPSTDDFRAPTVAWHVAGDGTIDPERYQQYPGLPPTLEAMLAYFGINPSATDLLTSSPGVATPSPTVASSQPSVDSGPDMPALAAVLVAVITIAAIVVYWLGRRRPA